MLNRNPDFSEFDPKKGRRGAEWDRIKKLVCPPGSLCWICKQPILFGLRPRHPKGPSVDHVRSLKLGGHPTDLRNLRPAHYGCNSRRGIGTRDAQRPRSRDY
jgi:5-methylcytosine-specific restriction endonuclease McrA